AAAEAAIANPLLDETSMKGAQGLLISITGGRDLTLFEVDEAATRIREEVDPDANIILGATFDEELEGLIRVSVVATGIDRTAAEVAGRTVDFRPVAPKPIVRPSAAIPAQPQPVAQHQPPAPQSQPVAQPVQQQNTVDQIALAIREAEMERELDIATRAQVAAPVHQVQHVQQMQEEAFRPQSKLFAGAAPVEAAPVVRQAPPVQRPVEMPVQAHVQPQVQPQPVRHEPAPVMRQQAEPVRMPKVEDFPPVVKAEIDHRAQTAPAHQEERGPMGLLKRITNSLSRRDDDDHGVSADMTAAAPSAASQQRRPLSPEASLYAPRRGQLDDHGRVSPQARSHEDDQLEIPAFLRRQSN
ncbi:cell division protein FtsZ, partial [Sinorhizobium sp. 6-117]|nr:cell division protein FtsZ [Sinorhizobium sp. 6-117]